MNFRFLPEDVALRSRPLGCLHASRNIHAAIGIITCPKDTSQVNLISLYDEFEKKVRASADIQVMRCLVFDPSDEQILQDLKSRPDLVLFPPGQGNHLLSHMEVVMHDFAASMLDCLEQKTLTVSPQSISLNSFIDSPEFLGSALSAVAFSTEDDAQKTKRKYGRVQKAMGDYALLSGSPLDAAEHYNVAVDLGKASQDWVYVTAAFEGLITAKLLNEAISRNAFPPSQYSVFHNEDQWRSPLSDAEVLESKRSSSVKDVPSPSWRPDGDELDKVPSPKVSVEPSLPRVIEESVTPVDDALDTDDPFSQAKFWNTLRSCEDLHTEISSIVQECKSAIRRRGALSLLVESELRYARLLAGLKGPIARRKVCLLASSIQLAAELLPLPEDRLVALIEAASILGSVGASRKRVLLLWQAVELSKYFGFPDEKTLAVARHALEPFVDLSESHDEWSVFKRPLSQDANIPNSWGVVKAGILEATLGLAIYASKHADVWDAAAALLREHGNHISQHRVRSLYDNLVAASSHMSPNDRIRPGKGPPPTLHLIGPCELTSDSALHVFDKKMLSNTDMSPMGSPTVAKNLFLYDAFADKRREREALPDDNNHHEATWVCGEKGMIEIEVYNPSSVTMKISRLVLQAECNGVVATKDQWKPKVVSLSVPPTKKPVKVQLEGTPLIEGEFVITGCRLTSNEGVSWWAPWSRRPPTLWENLGMDIRRMTSPEMESMRFTSLPKQPRGVLTLKEDGLIIDPPASKGGRKEPTLNLLQGQKVSGLLIFENTGPVAINHASFNLMYEESDGNVAASKILIDLSDPNCIPSALPLGPGSSIEIPISFSTDMIPSLLGQSSSNEPILHIFEVQYASDTSQSCEESEIIGRKATYSLGVCVRPSIGFGDISMDIVWSKSSDSDQWHQCCLALASVINRGSEPLRVQLGLEKSWSHSSESQQSELNPGDSCVVPLKIPPIMDFGSTEADHADIISDVERRKNQNFELDRQLSTAWLSKHIYMKFTGASVEGFFRPPRGELYHCLNPQVLSVIRKPGLRVALNLEGSGVEHRFIQFLGTEEQPTFSESGVPVACAKPGDVLSVLLSMDSTQDVPITASFNVSARSVSFAPALMECGVSTAIAWSSQMAHSSPIEAGFAWVGINENLSINIDAGGKQSERQLLTCCSPGWFQVQISDISVQATNQKDAKSCSSLVQITPVFLYVSDLK